MYPRLEEPSAKRFAIAQMTLGHTAKPSKDACPCCAITQGAQPVAEDIALHQLEHEPSVAYGSQSGNEHDGWRFGVGLGPLRSIGSILLCLD